MSKRNNHFCIDLNQENYNLLKVNIWLDDNDSCQKVLLYSSNNMESGLKSEAAMDSFEFWTELYTNYSFPTSASFVNRFRTGEMPIGIASYTLFNTLTVIFFKWRSL